MAKKFDYFANFEEQANYAVKIATLLLDLVDNYSGKADNAVLVEESHKLEHAADEVNHAIMDNIARDFITPLDREDLVNFCCCLDGIVDDIDSVVRLFYVYDVHEMRPEAIKFAQLILKECETIRECCKEFKNYKKPAKLKKLIIKVNDIEEEADELYLNSVRTIFTTENDKPVILIIWSRIFDKLESCCDIVEHSANVIAGAILKNS